MDKIVLNFFVENRIEWLSFLMLIITYSAGYLVATTVTVLSSLSFLLHKHINKVFAILVSIIGSTFTVFLLKNIFNKPRPLTEALYMEQTPSFPSGHATIALALYGFILHTLWKHDKHNLKNPFIFFLILLIALIGISRLYLGVHYFSDVLAGYLVGLIWLIVSIKIENKLR